MTDVVVSVENLSKKYCRKLKRSLWYGVKDLASDMTGRSKDQDTLRPEEFWALRDISFELKRGESLGLVGRNGAGKTTLLKLINGLIKPTAGRIQINGTVGALIALGTGFNPILTGRENVKIAGSVLGMSSREIDRRLEEILDFSEIGEFIDSPVKSYSSGMLVRLGFSVAIQLQPDLLLVDEVLAVGDLHFAIKCIKKITEYRNNGGSMILVSHGMHNIRFHCDSAMWIRDGKIMDYGPAHEVVDDYEQFTAESGMVDGELHVVDPSVSLGGVSYPATVSSDDPFRFQIEFITRRRIEKPIVVFAIFDVKGQHLISNFSHLDGFTPSFEVGSNVVSVSFPNLPLSNGVYSISIVLHENEIGNHLMFCKHMYNFKVENAKSTFGMLVLKSDWELYKN
ncbi:MAG: ABC transporter ATP-binding protein [Deltaproteobacteria bacterium]|nr:ABC transporter ATP-binding protein [Deltaproteobacteria bacterium]